MIQIKPILFHIFICFVFFANAQKLEFSVGLNRNSYFDLRKEDPHYQSEFKSRNGYTFTLSVDDFLVDTTPFTLPFRFGIRYTNFSGYITVTSGGLSYSNTSEEEVITNLLGVDFYPLNLSRKGLKFNLGVELNFLLNYRSNGNGSSWHMNQSTTHYEIDTLIRGKFEDRSFGLTSRIAYDIKISGNWFIIPQINLYCSIRPDKSGPFSFRQSFEIGIARNIK